MTITQALAWATQQLNTSPTPSLDAMVCLSYVLNQPKEFLYTHESKKLSLLDTLRFKRLVNRRRAGWPIAQLVHRQAFFGRDFYVNQHTLIPRPETELIIEQALRFLKNQPPMRVADIGTGSGCIAITLKKELPEITIYGVDNSRQALNVARKNAKRHHANVAFFHGDLIAPLKDQPIDLLIANLPYLPTNRMPDQSIAHEPPQALFAGPDGLSIYRQLFMQINKLASKPKIIICEIDPSQSQTILIEYKSLVNSSDQTTIINDLRDLPRIFIAKKSDPAVERERGPQSWERCSIDPR